MKEVAPYRTARKPDEREANRLESCAPRIDHFGMQSGQVLLAS